MFKWLMALCLAAILGFCNAARAELLPTSGVFGGYYHRDFQGVGHFSSFLVSPDLHEKLKEHEGKYIDLEVLNAVQVMNPGPGVIEKIGRIMELPVAPVKLSLKPRGKPVVGRAMEVLVTASDERKPDKDNAGSVFTLKLLSVELRQPGLNLGQDPDRDSGIAKGYSYRQLSTEDALPEFGTEMSAEYKPEDPKSTIHSLKALFVTEGGIESVELMQK